MSLVTNEAVRFAVRPSLSLTVTTALVPEVWPGMVPVVQDRVFPDVHVVVVPLPIVNELEVAPVTPVVAAPRVYAPAAAIVRSLNVATPLTSDREPFLRGLWPGSS